MCLDSMHIRYSLFCSNFKKKFFLIFIVSRPEKSVLAKTLNEHHWTYWFPLADLCFLLGCLFGIEFQTFLQTNSWMASWTPHEFSVSHLFRIFAGSRQKLFPLAIAITVDYTTEKANTVQWEALIYQCRQKKNKNNNLLLSIVLYSWTLQHCGTWIQTVNLLWEK